ncbi:receptor-like protein kinase HSL1 [Andrographis paniculata]|uniref:receptor-like protein kinase HSL1 n=1 Tax=Andrographis paniculata TaxID=175694 RepID=UPI0021E748E2|nr:receptor-like protein kinase HSL1 [Andrographis paniculata]
MTKLPFFLAGELLLITLLFSVPFLVTSQFSTTERDALLELKRGWGDSPAVHSWTASSSPCSWPEIRCSGDGSVTGILLNNYNLSGNLTDAISVLVNLTVLDLGFNFFTGNFPPGILNCSRLRFLDLSQNYFVGDVPASIDRLKSLQHLDLSGNNFTGDIPSTIGNLTQLRTLNLHMNLLNGSYPAEISNLRNLENLRMAYNDFSMASIPPEFGKLKNLKYLWMTQANAFGGIPESFSNLSSLMHLDLSMNNMEGEIPGGIFSLKNLTAIYLYHNRFSGSIPHVIESFSLIELDLSMNNLTGGIPEDFAKLKQLEILHLYSNNLYGEVPPGIGLLQNLKNFRIFRNNLSGTLPPEIGIHSKLESFEVCNNEFIGNLPDKLCAGGTLFGVVAFNNRLSGQIPNSLGNCKTLRTMQLYNNNFSGEVPFGIWSAPNMSSLMLSDNSFSGELPSKVAWNLTRLEISNNRFSGVIPPNMSSWASLIVFLASNNAFSGTIPQGLTSLPNLITLVLDGNSLSGELPSQIISWKSLNTLNLSRNELWGRIPSAFGSLPNLLYLDLSQNQFDSEIPPQLGQLRLGSLNLSSNKLTGRIPYELDNMAYENSFLNNPNLCSSNSVSGLLSCSYDKYRGAKKMSPKILAVVLVLALILLLVAVSVVLFTVRNWRRKRSLTTWKLTSFQRLDFTEINVLSSLVESNVIGFGASGKVYKVAVDRGQNVAVKRIWSDKNTTNLFLEKAFLAEIQTLGSIRHSNIVKLLCCISSDDSKLLVYEYVENESLDQWLHGKIRKGALDWPTRLKIAVGAAQGLCHMHHDCIQPIIHRDVKSSNILLDDDFNAKIADFGLAKILIKNGEANTMSTIAGSFGYIAPEYAYTTKVNEKVDVYSFGVVLLELVTGREASRGDEHTSLAEWAWKKHLGGDDNNENDVEAIDEEMRGEWYLEEMRMVFKLGLMCTSWLPGSRPSMKEVLQVLEGLGNHGRKGSWDMSMSPFLGEEEGKYIWSYRCDPKKLRDANVSLL